MGLQIRFSVAFCILLTFAAATGCRSSGPQYDLETARRQRYGSTAVSASPSATDTRAPAADVSASGAIVGRTMPGEIIVGQPFEYTVTVTNPTSYTRFENVVLSEAQSETVEILGSSPRGGIREGTLLVNLGTLGPGESRSVRVQARAVRQGAFNACATVALTSTSCQTFTAVQPAIQLVRIAPAQVMVCDPIPVTLRVTNGGTGLARNVQITESLPNGLSGEGGATTLTFDAGDLTPGQTREFTAQVRAARTGEFSSQTVAAAAGGLTARAQGVTRVVEPILTTEISSPQVVYLGKPITFEVSVRNSGDATAEQTKLESRIPPGARFVSADAGGVHDAATGMITWQLGSIAPDRGSKVHFTVVADELIAAAGAATATARCAAAATAQTQTQVRGIPAILLEVVDVEDPIQIGGDVMYRITVTNQGSATGRAIQIVADLEDAMGFVSAGGATPGAHAGGRITFVPLAELAAKAQAEWTVVVRAMKEGDVRFRVNMTEQRLTRPVQETEATNFYQ